jgi:hypothetical protein
MQRRHLRRHGGEFDNIGEQDAGGIVLRGDRALVRLEGLRDFPGKYVEQQHFGALLKEITLTDEVIEQPESDGYHRAYIEYEEPGHECLGQLDRHEIRLQEGA